MTDFGVLPIIKPVGITSFKVIHILRKITGIKKIGHTGTLDPFASGLLPICIGKATRIAGKITGKNKEYLVTMQLGIKTDTGDNTGKVVSEEDVYKIKKEQLTALKEQVLAITTQKPPKFSAIKINGIRAYELARKEMEVDLPERSVQILDFELLIYNHPNLEYRVLVSKGTYIRSLSETIAEMLGTVGTTVALNRSMIEGLEFTKQVALEKITTENWRNYLIPIPEFYPELPKIKIEKIDDFQHGRRIAVEMDDTEEILVLNQIGKFLGFGKVIKGELQPIMVFI
ncbi:MAG: tRNA pseudouridine(55) synthase TruB [Candidatus Cloacimonadales bacterium]|nr:tRNA pseudouridine(55) synthase TruB [Candidatus Cloacimonadales bacterium]